MKKILIHLSILSLLAFVSLPMTGCAPREETRVEVDVDVEAEADYMEEEMDEIDEYGVEMEEMEEEPPMEEMEEMEEEPPPAQ